MNQQNEKALRKYYKQIRALFPIHTAPEKRFFDDLKDAVNEFISDHPECTFSEIEKKFGEPREIISDYLETVDADYLYKQINRTKYIRRGIFICILIALLAFAVHSVYIHQAYLDAKNATIVEKEVTITYD